MRIISIKYQLMRYFVYFAYNGTEFHGSQTQPNGVTVQQTMEEAFALLLRQDVALTFAGRTDAGVHAEQMVAHFDWEGEVPGYLLTRLNQILPDAIALHRIVRVTDEAHARFTATARTYEYRVSDHKDVFLNTLRTRVREGLDYEAMNRAAKHLMGRQDFAAFARSHTDVKTTICTISHAEWTWDDEGHATFRITADRFLRNMVRAIVGTLLDVGRQRMSEADFCKVIASHDRCVAGQSAQAKGLYLTRIDYPDTIFIQ